MLFLVTDQLICSSDNICPNSRPLNPAGQQMFWQPFFCDLHGNYIPLYRHKCTSSTMCCVTAGQSLQCVGMNSEASFNEFNTNCKSVAAVPADDSEETTSRRPSLLLILFWEEPGLQIKSNELRPHESIQEVQSVHRLLWSRAKHQHQCETIQAHTSFCLILTHHSWVVSL